MRKSAAYAVFITGACPEIASGGATPRRQMNAAASSETAIAARLAKKSLKRAASWPRQCAQRCALSGASTAHRPAQRRTAPDVTPKLHPLSDEATGHRTAAICGMAEGQGL